MENSVIVQTEQAPPEKVEKKVGYWRQAASVFQSSRMIAFAALICALRIAVKAANILIAPGVKLTFDCYVNAIGALIYGPLMGLAVGAISDTVGYLLFPNGVYFFPFIFVEMSSAFIFGLFFWRRKLNAGWAVFAKFCVNLFCNIILTSLVMKLQYAIMYTDKVYYLFNAVRIVKNLVLFPLEGVLICLLLNAILPALRRLNVVESSRQAITFRKRDIALLIVLFLLAIALVLFYVLFFKDFLDAHNVKF